MEEMLWHTAGKWPEKVRKSLDYPADPLFKILDDTADKYSEKTYTIYDGIGHSFTEVKDSPDKIANFFVSQGIQKGDRLAIFLPNTTH